MPKSGFQPSLETLKGRPPKSSVQLNTLQTVDLKRWVIKESARRGLSLSQFVGACIQIVRENPELLKT